MLYFLPGLMFLALTGIPALAGTAIAPQPMPARIAAPKNIAYPGTIQLFVDATDTQRGVFRVSETIPVAGPGVITLLYPKWLPGNHAPSGPIDKFAGLAIRANGAPLAWTRDPVEIFAFHVEVPGGVTALEVEFQYLSPLDDKQGRVVMTPALLNLQWNTVALYPAGYFTRQIPVKARVKLPEGWQFGTALETDSTQASITTFKTTPFDTLLDSPMFAGINYKRIDLDPAGPVPVHLNIIADRPSQLEATPDQIAAHRALVGQAYKLFGAHHYDHYDFLLALSEEMTGIGLEHHRSSENGVPPSYFTEWDATPAGRDLLAHEFVHSWNGKFRRGDDLWTPDFNTPMRNSLLWVYEGQTQYWGYVLAARAGLLTKQDALDAIANVAATYDYQSGRAWRALADTTNEPIISGRRTVPWADWLRGEDYYSEGQLIWLDADTLIRQLSQGKRSLDDFAKAFFGGHNGSYDVVTYKFEDIVATLNSVQPYDWAAFLRARLESHGPGAPLDGIKRGGYELVYTDTPSEFSRSVETRRKSVDFRFSLGFMIGESGTLTSVRWNGPAFQAGLTIGTKIIAVNGFAYKTAELREAIKAARDNETPIELIVLNGNRYQSVRLNYHGGLRYPHLKRIENIPARLDEILASRK